MIPAAFGATCPYACTCAITSCLLFFSSTLAVSKSSSVTTKWSLISFSASSLTASIPSSFSASARYSHSLRHVECRDRWLKSCDISFEQYRPVSEVWYVSKMGEPILDFISLIWRWMSRVVSALRAIASGDGRGKGGLAQLQLVV